VREKDPPSTHQHEVFAKAQPGTHIRRSLGHAQGLPQNYPAQQIGRYCERAGAVVRFTSMPMPPTSWRSRRRGRDFGPRSFGNA